MKPFSFPRQTPFVVKISFEDIIIRLEEKATTQAGEIQASTHAFLKELATYPELKEGITSISFLEENEALIHRLFADYFPEPLTNNEIKGIAIPFMPVIFNKTKRFQALLSEAGQDFKINIRDFEDHQTYIFSCLMILSRVYGTPLDFKLPLFFDIPTKQGTVKHYRILFNIDFIQIIPTEKSIPITQADIDLLVNNYDDLALWQEKFPPDSWILKGFSIITLFDSTVENAVSVFKEKLLSIEARDFQPGMTEIIRSIYGIPNLRLGFCVYREDEKKFGKTMLYQNMSSFILTAAPDGKDAEVLNKQAYQRIVQEHTYYTISDVTKALEHDGQNKFLQAFHNQGIQSFILAPVVKNNTLLGVLEIVAEQPGQLNSITANRLQMIVPFLADKVERLVVEIGRIIQAFIQERFTTIHKSVNWKFQEEARAYLGAHKEGRHPILPEIVFDHIHPLYGQIDVKGSSEARNESVQKDLQHQLETILTLIDFLHARFDISLLTKEKVELQYFHEAVCSGFNVSTELDIMGYLESHIHPVLRAITHYEASAHINDYLQETHKDDGQFHTYRKKYENTMEKINESLSAILDAAQDSAQNLFPHYYERFKTDGVEHTLYIGNSIAPKLAFDHSKIHALQLWQLRITCAMAQAHYNLMPSLPYALPVTALIFVYHTSISIRFRMDEKRFDVNGSYNIRYEIIKKRIDKANIKNTTERLTIPGKITIVFSSRHELLEYQKYIHMLQRENILANDLEEVDVEDLQGVVGLKALRASILQSA